MKKVLVVIVVGLLGVVGYQMEQMDNLIQSNKALEKQNSDLQDRVIHLEDYVGDYHEVLDELNHCLGIQFLESALRPHITQFPTYIRLIKKNQYGDQFRNDKRKQRNSC